MESGVLISTDPNSLCNLAVLGYKIERDRLTFQHSAERYIFGSCIQTRLIFGCLLCSPSAAMADCLLLPGRGPAAVLPGHCATGPLCHRDNVPQGHCAAGPLCHRATMPQSPCATGSPCCQTTVLPGRQAARPLCHRTTMPQGHHAALLPCHSATVPGDGAAGQSTHPPCCRRSLLRLMLKLWFHVPL